MDDQRLAQLLLERKLLTPPQLRNAVNLQRQTGGTLQQIIVKLNYVKPSELNALIAEVEHLRAIGEIPLEAVHKEAMKQIPRKVIEKYHLVPLYDEEDEGTIVLAMEDPNQFQAIEEIQFLTGKRVEPALASRQDITKALNLYYNRPAEETPSPKASVPSLESEVDKLLGQHNVKDVLRSLLLVGLKKNLFTLEDILENI